MANQILGGGVLSHSRNEAVTVSPPIEIPFWDDSVRAASTMSLRLIILDPLLTALQVMTAFGLQSMILWTRDSEEKPANTT